MKQADAGEHYRRVCQDLVTEVTDISSLLAKLNIKSLEELSEETEVTSTQSQQWKGTFREARLVLFLSQFTRHVFSQKVMQELLYGVELRKVEPAPRREATLTSHEILMREIKSRKVVLKPPDISTQAQVERDARDQMMDIIKSRPPLKSVMERKLPSTPRQQETPVEKLLSDIRGGKARQSLRRARTRTRLNTSSLVRSIEKVVATESRRGKKKILPEHNFQSSIYNFDESPNTSFDEDSVFADSGNQDVGEIKGGEGSVEAPALLKGRREGKGSSDEIPLVKAGKKGSSEGTPHTLTLQELSSIRWKLTAAQLEMKEVSQELRLALDSGRVCFSCEKTKFNLFNWAHHCKVCQRSVCKGKPRKTRRSLIIYFLKVAVSS